MHWKMQDGNFALAVDAELKESAGMSPEFQYARDKLVAKFGFCPHLA
jgi:hypothetical protein